MGIKPDDVKEKLSKLITRGRLLYYSLVFEELNDDKKRQFIKDLKDNGIEADSLVSFNLNYEVWYSEALLAVKLFIPDRLNDFVILYKNDKRKNVDFLTYTISDAIIGVSTSRGMEQLTNRATAAPKMLQQVSILESAKKSIESVFYSMQFSLRAELFDSELDAAGELFKVGFFRATGAMCGVILEKHLANVCQQHGISLKKKSPTINDFNEELKNATVIDLPTWRHIQLLGDLRNLCCHDKSKEPTKEQTNDLLDGTTKIIKTVY